MTPRPSVKAAGAPQTGKPGHAQKELAAALTRLDLTHTAGVCSNAAMMGDLPTFIVALRDAATKDADQRDALALKQAAKAAGVPFPSAALGRFETTSGRGVSKHEIASVAAGRWARARENLCIQGKTQTGKSYLASALATDAIREGLSVLYRPTTQLLREWHAAFREGPAYFDALRKLTREADVLVLDDFGEGSLHEHDLGYLRELITERFNEEGKSVCVVTSSAPERWEEWMVGSDEGKAVSARLTNAFRKFVLMRNYAKGATA